MASHPKMLFWIGRGGMVYIYMVQTVAFTFKIIILIHDFEKRRNVFNGAIQSHRELA